jgi:hypothetical protein
VKYLGGRIELVGEARLHGASAREDVRRSIAKYLGGRIELVK